MIYLDYNATAPVLAEVREAILPYFSEAFGNPSCLYALGKEAREAIEQARKQVADFIHASPQEIIFTSGGTESNNTVFKGVLWALREEGRHVITTQIEHPSVVNPAMFMTELGFKMTFVPPDTDGIVRPEEVEKAIKKGTVLISVIHANNETGVIQPIEEIAKIAREKGIFLHTDAAQSLGKIAVDVEKLGVDLLTIAGHKLYAPKGIGALYIRKGTPFVPLMHGSGQENNQRAGTENVAFTVALGKACSLLKEKLEKKENLRLAKLRDRLWQSLSEKLEVVRFGHPQQCLPNTLFVSFKGQDGREVLKKLPEICASPGAACQSGKVALSNVLLAMGVAPSVARGAVRFSLGYPTTEEEIDEAVSLIVERLKSS